MKDLNNRENGMDSGGRVEAAVADGGPEESVGAPEAAGCKPARHGGGPRTQHGKGTSRRNALKHGFFAREVLIETEFFKEDKKGFQRLLKGLADDWKPVGVSEVIQVELMTVHLLQYRRLLRVQQGLILECNTPPACFPDHLVEGELRQLKIERGLIREDSRVSCSHLDDPLASEAFDRAREKYEDRFGRAARLEEEHVRIGRLKDSLPVPSGPEGLQKYEAHILRQYYRAMAELERLQRMRLGDGVPPRLVVEVNQN